MSEKRGEVGKKTPKRWRFPHFYYVTGIKSTYWALSIRYIIYLERRSVSQATNIKRYKEHM